jgi:hypothetical protein
MSLAKTAVWAAGLIALGWLVTALSLGLPGGHPPAWWVIGMGVVMASFVIAPVGAFAGLADLRRARRRGDPASLVMAAVGLNLLFLAIAAALWFWMLSLTTRR